MARKDDSLDLITDPVIFGMILAFVGLLIGVMIAVLLFSGAVVELP